MTGETVTVLTGTPAADVYSGDVASSLDWSEPSEVDVTGCAVAPRTSTEPVQDGRTAVIDGLTIYMPPGTVVGPHNRLRVRGSVYEVDGDPGVWVSPFTQQTAGVEVNAKRVTG